MALSEELRDLITAYGSAKMRQGVCNQPGYTSADAYQAQEESKKAFDVLSYYVEELESNQRFPESTKPEIEIDEIFGVSFRPRGRGDDHVCIVLHGGDDGLYWEMGSYSSYWIDMIIKTLEEAKRQLETDSRFVLDEEHWGFKQQHLVS